MFETALQREIAEYLGKQGYFTYGHFSYAGLTVGFVEKFESSQILLLELAVMAE